MKVGAKRAAPPDQPRKRRRIYDDQQVVLQQAAKGDDLPVRRLRSAVTRGMENLDGVAVT